MYTSLGNLLIITATYSSRV